MPDFKTDSMFNITRLLKYYYENNTQIPSFILENTNIFETSSLALTIQYEDDDGIIKYLNREEKSNLVENFITHLPFEAYKSFLDKYLNVDNYEIKKIIQLSLHTHNYDVLNYLIEIMMPDLTGINKTNMYSSENLFNYSRNVLEPILNFDNFRTLNNYYSNDDSNVFINTYKKALFNYEKLQKIRNKKFSLKKDWFKNSDEKMPFNVQNKDKKNIIQNFISENETLSLIIEISKQYSREENPFLTQENLIKAYKSGNIKFLNYFKKEYSLVISNFKDIYIDYINYTNQKFEHLLFKSSIHNSYDINRDAKKIIDILKYSYEHLPEKEFLDCELSFILYLKPKYIEQIKDIIPDIKERKIRGLNYEEWITLSYYLHSFITENSSGAKIKSNLASNIANHLEKNFPDIKKGTLNTQILEIAVNEISFENKTDSTKFQHYLMNYLIEKKEKKNSFNKI